MRRRGAAGESEPVRTRTNARPDSATPEQMGRGYVEIGPPENAAQLFEEGLSEAENE